MRKLMWFTIGFGCACAVGAYLIYGNILAALGIAAVLTGVVFLLAARKWDCVKPVGLVFVGLAAGLLWFWCYDGGYLSPARELDGVITTSSFEIVDYSSDTDYGIKADANASWQGKTYRVRVYLNEQYSLEPGDVVSGEFRFRITNEGGESEPTYLRGNGIPLIAYQRGSVTVEQKDVPWWTYPAAYLRHEILELLQEVFPVDTAGFARALLLGDSSGIDYELNTAFKVSGIRHIIAVSGLHVSILFGFVYTLAGKRRWLTAFLGLPVLALFAAVAGFTPSVTRACLMHGLMILALLFEKEYDPPTALSFAALVMLVVNPVVITSISFQLSVGCMAGIFLFAGKIREWLLDDKRMGHAKGKSVKARLIRGVAGSIGVSLGAASITTPLSALYFGTVSLIGPLTNLLTLWVVTLVFYGIMAVCALGWLLPQAAVLLAKLVSWPIRYILWTAKLLAQVPMAAVYTRSDWIVCWLYLCYLLLLIFLLMKNKRPLVFGCIAVSTLCAALLASWIPPLVDECRVTVLDVGQGQSIILQGDGKTFVVDCGGSYADDAADTAAETLLSMGISRIDGLILTHYDTDHAGGVQYLLSRIRAEAVYLPVWEEAQTAAELQSLENALLVTENTTLAYGDAVLTLIPSEIRDSSNESSMCVLFQAGNCDILITGDRGTLGEKLLLQQVQLPELDVLVVGHHGSKYSTSEALLKAARPRVAVISVGEGNAFGQPAQEILDRLEEAGCVIFRTDEDGTIIIRR